MSAGKEHFWRLDWKIEVRYWKSLCHVQLFVTPWTIQSMQFSRPEYEVGSLSLLQGIFLTRGSNPGFLHCRWILYQLSQRLDAILQFAVCANLVANRWCRSSHSQNTRGWRIQGVKVGVCSFPYPPKFAESPPPYLCIWSLLILKDLIVKERMLLSGKHAMVPLNWKLTLSLGYSGLLMSLI